MSDEPAVTAPEMSQPDPEPADHPAPLIGSNADLPEIPDYSAVLAELQDLEKSLRSQLDATDR